MYSSSYSTPSFGIVNMPHHRASSKTAARRFMLRIALIFIVILVAFSAGALVTAKAGTNDKRVDVSVTSIHEVQLVASPTGILVEQGDTLWDIAKTYSPTGTYVRTYIEQIKKLNHLKGSSLRVGQRLLLP